MRTAVQPILYSPAWSRLAAPTAAALHPQILRAMENLKLALRLRVSRGPLNEEQINAVAPLIDAAATGVEQVT